jgi:hypothetical protein
MLSYQIIEYYSFVLEKLNSMDTLLRPIETFFKEYSEQKCSLAKQMYNSARFSLGKGQSAFILPYEREDPFSMFDKIFKDMTSSFNSDSEKAIGIIAKKS